MVIHLITDYQSTGGSVDLYNHIENVVKEAFECQITKCMNLIKFNPKPGHIMDLEVWCSDSSELPNFNRFFHANAYKAAMAAHRKLKNNVETSGV